MISKAIIVVLTLAALGIAVIGVDSSHPRGGRFHETLLFASDVFSCEVRDGVWIFFFLGCPHCGSYPNHVTTCLSSKQKAYSGPPVFRDALRIGQFRWRIHQSTYARDYSLWLPTWALFAPVAAYPTIAFIRGPLRRWHRGKRGLCLTCGYNLTGLPEPRCPECGTAFDGVDVRKDQAF